MTVFIVAFLYVLLQGADSQFTVAIVSSPAGIVVNGYIYTNTFDYPILSSITLTCMVYPTPSSSITYQWNTTRCYTNSKFTGSNPQCFPHGQTTQSVTGNDLIAHDAGNVTCTAKISGSNYTSDPFSLRISGVVVTRDALTLVNALTDYSYINARVGSGNGALLVHCLTGLAPSGNDNGVLGGLYFNGNMIPNSGETASCSSDVIQVRSGASVAGVINIHQCGAFSTTVEGIYTCTMMNSSMMSESVRFGIYLNGRTAPVIDTPSSSTVTVAIGSSLTLSCTSQGSPPDTFTWRKDNDPTVLQSTSITAVDHTSTSAVFRADYSIYSVTTSDSGTYTCIVTNPIGSDSAAITVANVFPPTNVRATVVTSHSIHILWEPSSSDAIGYLISYITTASYASDGSVIVEGGSTASHTLISVEENTVYTITVQAIDSDNDTSFNSNEVSIRTYTDVPSSPPRRVMVATYNPASLIVSWRLPPNRDRNGPITGHVIQYTRVGSSDMMSVNVTSGTIHTISGLVAYVNYSVIVAAMTVNGTGPFSDPLVVGRSGEDVPSEPLSLEVISVNSSSLTLQWRPPTTPNGIITQYSILINGINITNFGNSMLMGTIGGLSPDTVYVLQLRAHTGVGAGSPSSISFLTSLGPVSNVDVRDESVTSSALTLTWMDISMTSSDFSHYRVFYLPVRGPYGPIMASSRRKRQSPQNGELTMNFNGTTGTLTNLNGAVTYSIQVAAVTTFNGRDVIGDRSAAIEITTFEGVPTAPRDFNYMNPYSTGVMLSVTLTWRRPDPPNGIIIQYNVSYITTNTQLEIFYNFTIVQVDNTCSSIESSYTWSNLIQGEYQFSVVAFTSEGPGEAANLSLSTLLNNEATSSDDSDDYDAVIIALVTLLIIAVIGLVISIVINVFVIVKLKQSRYDVSKSTTRYSDVKQSLSRDDSIKDPIKYVPSEPEYELVESDYKPDVTLDANPAYQ